MKTNNFEVGITLGDSEKWEKKVTQLRTKYKISDFDIKTLFAEEKKIDTILEEIDYLPVFSKKRLLNIKNCEKLTKSDCEKLEIYFKNPPEHICILFVGIDIKAPLKKYVEDSVEDNKFDLFPQVFKLKRKEDRKKLISLLMEQLKYNESGFAPIITAGEIYLKNVLLNQRRKDIETINKFKILHQLDFDLKRGVRHTGAELEMFLHYIFK
ncbi:hypothetical protein M0P98_07960 [bacterium]|nr:hypothetical protein [bacterium]